MQTQGEDMRRVMKAEVVGMDRVNTPDGLEICLECWKQYIQLTKDNDLTITTMPGMVSDDTYGLDMYEQQQLRDMETGAATDAMIDSLSKLHKWAIYKLTSMAYVAGPIGAEITIHGPVAKELLKIKLKNNCCTSILFN
jgi:hypothetical protein